jgi:hypothetical protein
MTKIAIVRQTSGIGDADIVAALPSLQKQVTEHFAPIWGMGATLYAGPQAGAQVIYLMDGIGQPQDFGYHIDDSGGISAKVDAQAILAANYDLWGVVSHELLEMLADPLTTRMQNNVMVEVCDPVAEMFYDLDGVQVANFATPSWFGFDAGTRYDWMQTLTGPYPAFGLGGYITTWTGTGYTTQASRMPDGRLSGLLDRQGRSHYRASRRKA